MRRWLFFVLISLCTSLAVAMEEAVPAVEAGKDAPVIIYTYSGEFCRECQSYQLKLFTSGRALFDGTVLYYELPPSSSKTIARDIRETTVSAEAIERWLNVLTSQGFFSLLPHYDGRNCAADDRSEQALTLHAAGKSKTVSWVGCSESEVPRWLSEVANDVRKKVNPDQWIKVVPNPRKR